MKSLALAALAALFLAAPAPALADDGDGPPPEKKKLTAAELEERLDKSIVSVDWKDTSVLDAIADLVSKSGVKIAIDATLGKFGGARTVTFRDFRISLKGALAKLRPEGVDVQVDEPAQGFRATMAPEFPTECALREKKITVHWKDAPLAKAIAEVEKKTGVKVELGDSMKSHAPKKVTLEAEDMLLEAAITALYEGVSAKVKAKPNMVASIEFTGAPTTKAEVERALDERGFAILAADGPERPLADATDQLARMTQITIECDAKLKKAAPKVKLGPGPYKARAALDELAKQANATWKVEGAKVVFHPK